MNKASFKKIQFTLRTALGASLLLHLLAFVVLRWQQPDRNQQPAPVEVTLIDSETVKLKRPQVDKTQQIVEQRKESLNDEVPDEAAYLSLNNQRVARETKAKNHGTFNDSAGGQNRPSPNSVVTKNRDQKTPRSRTTSVHKGLPTLAQLKPKFNWDEASSAKGARPTADQPSQNDDYLKEVDNGLQTLLNTREFVYYTYYTRIKRKISIYWEPLIKEKMLNILRRGRSVASATQTDRITQVVIILDAQGILRKVQVIGESGVRDLDEAAIEAFKAAAPFPNPPSGMIESDGNVRIRWDFVLEA